MRLAWTTLGSPHWPVSQVFAAAAASGYEGVELRCLHGQLVTPALPAGERAEIREQVRRSGLPVIAVGASSAFSHPDPAVRLVQEEDLCGMLQLAADIGAPLVRAYGGGFPQAYGQDSERAYGGTFPAGSDADAICTYIAASLARVAARAADLGLTVVVETHDGLSSAAMMSRVLDLVRAPQIQALWDVLHPTRMGESPEYVWDRIGSRVRHVHFKDGARDASGRWRAAALGEGEVPLPECLRVLQRSGYAGWITLEWEKYWEPEIAEPEVALPHMIATTRRWLAAED